MNTLKQNLEEIQRQKFEYIVPENIKKGVQIFDVVGTLETGTSTSGVKLFETQEEMQADITAQEGDLAVVYREEIQNMTSDTQTQYIIFPETVTLPQAIVGNYTCHIQLKDLTSHYGESSIDITIYSLEEVNISILNPPNDSYYINYASTDGTNYTRTRFEGNGSDLTNPVYLFGGTTYCDNIETWSDIFGYFMQVNGYAFDGLFRYNSTNSVYEIAPNQFTARSNEVYNSTFYSKNGVEKGVLPYNVSNSFGDINAEICSKILQFYENMEPVVLADNTEDVSKNIYFIPTKSDGTPLLDTSNVIDMSYKFSDCTNLITIPLLDTHNTTKIYHMCDGCVKLVTISKLDTSNVTDMRYAFENCQNLKTLPLLDTYNVTRMENTFKDCINLENIPQFNTTNVTYMENMFNNCQKITELPQLDTQNVTSMFSMCRGCISLVTVPVLDTSKVKTMAYMFADCPNLSDDSLNNILQMSINATAYTDDKHLNRTGLSEEQATKCTTLSNYQAFTEAGWTTGY